MVRDYKRYAFETLENPENRQNVIDAKIDWDVIKIVFKKRCDKDVDIATLKTSYYNYLIGRYHEPNEIAKRFREQNKYLFDFLRQNKNLNGQYIGKEIKSNKEAILQKFGINMQESQQQNDQQGRICEEIGEISEEAQEEFLELDNLQQIVRVQNQALPHEENNMAEQNQQFAHEQNNMMQNQVQQPNQGFHQRHLADHRNEEGGRIQTRPQRNGR